MLTDSEKYEVLILGALMHDIGKFLERAGVSDKIENGSVQYSHPKIGAKYIKYNMNLEDDIMNIVLFHHNPEYAPERLRYLCKIIRLSDWLSSGEREESKDKIKENREYQHLISIFEHVGFSEKTKKTREEKLNYEKSFKYNFAPLTFNNIILPKKEPAQLKIKYLFEGITNKENPNFGKFPYFNNEIKEFDPRNHSQLLCFIQKYWWCVPSATWWEKGKYLPDVSLYDHSKTTCAIAACLYKQGIVEKDLDEMIANPSWNEKRDTEVWKQKLFALIHGDLSGIQNFIYTIITKSAAKSLKGRSLMVVLLQRFIAEHILKKLNLPLSNLIYSGGGHFYILAPKNLCGLDLKEVRKEINKNLKEAFGTKLYLALGCVDVCPEDFIKENFAKKWKDVAEEASKQKMRKYKEFEYNDVFKTFDEGGEREICSICGKELKDNDTEVFRDDDTEIKICKYCKQFIDISNYLKQIQDEGCFEISEMKKRFEVLKNFDTILNGKIFLNPSGGVPFFSIPMGIPIIQGNDKKDIKEFKQLAEDAKKDTGTNKIGILKMDVDCLGKIFTKGLGDNATISRMSTLSSMLSLFFEGYLNEFIKEKYKGEVYLIYAGGDDTFVVGRWDNLIEFSYEVYKEFREYTCNNPDITLSAGLVIVSPTHPLRRAAEMTENELDEAKRVEFTGHEKNSICIFNQPLKWCIKEDESINDFEMVQDIEKILVKCVKDGAPRQLIQRVNVSARGLKKALKNKDKDKNHGIDINDYWCLKYYFHRNYKDKNGQWKYPELENLIEDLYKKIINAHMFKKDIKYDINLISIAARIAELKTRGEKNV